MTGKPRTCHKCIQGYVLGGDGRDAVCPQCDGYGTYSDPIADAYDAYVSEQFNAHVAEQFNAYIAENMPKESA